MSETPLRIGFAGAHPERGWAKDAHLAAVRAVPGLRLQAVSARDQAQADAAAAAFGAPAAFGDTLAMVRDAAIDAVAVTVKVPEHRAIVLAALEAGKHVYCEWPLGRDVAEAEEMAAAAARAGTHVAIGLQALHAPAIRHAAAIVAGGALGRLLSLRVVSPTAGWGDEAPPFYAYLQDRRNGATLSTIAGGHTLAAIEAVVGRYQDVSALNSIQRPRMRITGSEQTVERTSPDHVLVIGRHEGGCVSSLEVIGGVTDQPFRFELRGTEGRLEITGGHPGGFQAGPLSVTITPPASAPPEPAVAGLEAGAINVAEAWSAFLRDIREDARTVPDFASAVRISRLLAAIDVASDSGTRVPVEEP